MFVGWWEDISPVHNWGVPEETGHKAADKHSTEHGLERFCQWRGLYPDGINLPHTNGTTPNDGAKSQVSRNSSHLEL